MKSANAIMQFFNKGPTCNHEMFYPPISVRELKDMKESCDLEEYHELGKQACLLLGFEFEE